jgi:hypothetical protein
MNMAIEVQHETYMVTMTPAEWAAVPDNPRQRDTEKRAKNAKHLHQLHSTHTLVHMAEWNGGSCKLEGHTRAKIWHDMPEIAPDSVDVRVYVVDSEEDAKNLYEHFNSKEESQTTTDRLFGAMRESGIYPKSVFVSGCRFTNAVRTAHTYACRPSNPSGGRKAPVHEGVKFFRDEIIAMDRLEWPQGKAVGCAACCFLLARMKHGPTVEEFFLRYMKDGGIKNGRMRDCVQIFSDAVAQLSAKSGGGFTHFHEAVCIGLACVDRWIKSDFTMLSRAPKCDPYRYLE